MPEVKVSVVGTYNGDRQKWAIGRFPNDDGSPGIYRIGVFVEGGISFSTTKSFTSREDAEGWLVYQVDASVKIG